MFNERANVNWKHCMETLTTDDHDRLTREEVMQIPNLPKSRLLLAVIWSLAIIILLHVCQPNYLSSRSTPQDIQFAYHTNHNGSIESSQKIHIVRQHPRSNENETRYSSTAELVLKKFVPQIFQRVPKTFLPQYKSPCWFEDEKLKCLPYFYQIGSYKSGTSDLWDKLVQHPSVGDVLKEPHWWAWRRFGYTDLPCHGDMVKKIRALTGEKDDSSFEWYLNWFDFQLNKSLQENPQLIFGDASITTLWGIADGRANYTAPEPIYVLADIIQALQPNAKIFAILRNPLERAMSEYFYSFKDTTKTPEQFHAEVERSLIRTQACLERQKSARACAFSLKIGNWRDFVSMF